MLYPPKCKFCGHILDTSKRDICTRCKNSLRAIEGEVCHYCGAELDKCLCAPFRHDYKFERNVAVYYYDGPAREIIRRLKFCSRPQLCEFMADLMVKSINTYYAGIVFDAVVFVPMLRVKQIDRGYNQAQLLAESIANRLNLDVQYNVVGRHLKSKTQKNLTLEQRVINAKGSFFLKDSSNIIGKTILLVDDVFTSGSTISECAGKLKEGGASKVYTVTFTVPLKNNQ